MHARLISHALLVLGGLAGLELTIEADAALGLKAEESDAAFDNWINVCPSQGSRTIRTEVSWHSTAFA